MSNTALFRFLLDQSKRSRLIGLRDAVMPILANNLQTEFTDHSCDHSDAVVHLVDQLAGPMQSGSRPLSERELFVLYAACYLHDIGMQYENAGHTQTIRNAKLNIDWASLSREERSTHLRRLHPMLAAEMVSLSVRSSSPPIGFALTDEDDPQLIAFLCEAHGLDVDSERYRKLAAIPAVRMDLLSGLLRMADILEESSRRAKRRKAETLLLPIESQAHWWRHYYTREVDFDTISKCITLIFDFPAARRQDYADLVPNLNVPNIQDELRRHAQPFARYGVPWVIKPLVDDNPYGVAEDMPLGVMLIMSGWLKDAAEQEAEQRQKAVEIIYERIQPAIKSLIDEVEQLPPETPPLVKAAKLVAVADYLDRLEAYRSEAAYLEQAYRLSEQTGDAALQLRLGLRLLPLRSRYANEVREHHLLTECERIAEAAGATEEQRLNIAVLKAQLNGTLCGHPAMLPAYRQAVNEAVSMASTLSRPQVCDILIVELAEVEWLLGETDAATATLTSLAAPTESIQDVGAEPHPAARATVLHARIMAGKGNLQRSLALIAQSLSVCVAEPEAIRTRLLLLNANAELCYLSNQPDNAFRSLSAALEEPGLRDHLHLKLVLGRNYLLCRLASSAPNAFRLHNEMSDAGELSDPGERDTALLRALNDQRAGRHGDAWPVFWRELCQAYRNGAWERYWKAEEYYSTQCFLLGWLELTIRHALRGHAAGLIEDTAKAVLTMRDTRTVQSILTWLTENRLARHYVITCKFLIAVVDAIPDASIDELVSFLLLEAVSLTNIAEEAITVRPAWQVLHALAPALDQERAGQLLDATEQLTIKDVNVFLVKEIVEVLDQSVPVFSDHDLDRAANLLFPLANESPDSDNYQIYCAEVLDALAHIWARLDAVQGKILADRLFPPGGTTSDILKLTILPVFHKLETNDANHIMINDFARTVAGWLRLQVQLFALDDPAEPQALPWALGTMAYQDQDTRRIVSMGGGIKGLWAAVAHMERLEPQTVQILLEACLGAARNQDNIISNRTSILQAIGRMGKWMSEEQRETIRASVLPLARGELVGENNRSLHNDANNPLNPFKINVGSPDDLQGVALYCLAKIERDAPSPQFDRIWLLLEQVIVSPNAATRRHATAAVWVLPTLNNPLFMAVLCGLRDTDSDTAAFSYWALASKKNILLNDFSAGLLLVSLERAAQSSSAAVRAGASALVKRIENWLPATLALREQRIAIQQIFESDVCRSVRGAAYQPANAPD